MSPPPLEPYVRVSPHTSQACHKPPSGSRLHNGQTKLMHACVAYGVQKDAVAKRIRPARHLVDDVVVVPAGFPRDAIPTMRTQPTLRAIQRAPLLLVDHELSCRTHAAIMA